MTKLIGIKELQTNTKKIREEVEKGVNFIVVWRSKPIFEIRPLANGLNFADDVKLTGLYTEDFVKRMKQAENDVNLGEVRSFGSTEEFLKSIS